jgi:chromosome segregation ATPase
MPWNSASRKRQKRLNRRMPRYGKPNFAWGQRRQIEQDLARADSAIEQQQSQLDALNQANTEAEQTCAACESTVSERAESLARFDVENESEESLNNKRESARIVLERAKAQAKAAESRLAEREDIASRREATGKRRMEAEQAQKDAAEREQRQATALATAQEAYRQLSDRAPGNRADILARIDELESERARHQAAFDSAERNLNQARSQLAATKAKLDTPHGPDCRQPGRQRGRHRCAAGKDGFRAGPPEQSD